MPVTSVSERTFPAPASEGDGQRMGLTAEQLRGASTEQLNDTHPAIASTDLLRLLVDEHAIGRDWAWAGTTAAIAATNHTPLPEALECWDLQLSASLLPHHLGIIVEINHPLLLRIRPACPGDQGRLCRMSSINEHGHRCMGMADHAAVAFHRVNGFAELHSAMGCALH